MDVRLVAEATWRYPDAKPIWLDGHGWALCLSGEPEEVIPRGVYKSDEVGNNPQQLETTPHDAFLDLDRISQVEDDSVAAAEFAAHA